MNMEEEAQQATQLLEGKVFEFLWRHRKGEILIQFVDGTRLFINQVSDDLELSITGNIDNSHSKVE
jgi:hypothetical protein